VQDGRRFFEERLKRMPQQELIVVSRLGRRPPMQLSAPRSSLALGIECSRLSDSERVVPWQGGLLWSKAGRGPHGFVDLPFWLCFQ